MCRRADMTGTRLDDTLRQPGIAAKQAFHTHNKPAA